MLGDYAALKPGGSKLYFGRVIVGELMKGKDFVEKLREEFQCETKSQLAQLLGRTSANISTWRKNPDLKPMVVARAMRELADRAQGETEALREELRKVQIAHSISTILEYAPIAANHKAQAEYSQIKAEDGYGHPEIRKRLEDKRGIYVFYSSLCQAVYVGKANDTELWRECNTAFNRDLKSDLYKVNHPSENKKQPRRITLSKCSTKVYKVATFLSVYEVDKALVDMVEALLIRAFINQLPNVKIENLAQIESGEI